VGSGLFRALKPEPKFIDLGSMKFFLAPDVKGSYPAPLSLDPLLIFPI
jgi:hypothetical protein